MADQPLPISPDDSSRKRDCADHQETMVAVRDSIKKRRGSSCQSNSTVSSNTQGQRHPKFESKNGTTSSTRRKHTIKKRSDDENSSLDTSTDRLPTKKEAPSLHTSRKQRSESADETTTLDAVTDAAEQPDIETALLKITHLSSSEHMAREYLNDRQWLVVRTAKSDDRAELSTFFKEESPSYVDNLMAALDGGGTFALLGYVLSEDQEDALSAVVIVSVALKHFERALFIETLKAGSDLLRRRLWLRLSLLAKYADCKHILTAKGTLEAIGEETRAGD